MWNTRPLVNLNELPRSSKRMYLKCGLLTFVYENFVWKLSTVKRLHSIIIIVVTKFAVAIIISTTISVLLLL